MASAPQYVGSPKNGTTQISTANTNRDGTGTLGTVLTAGASGSRVDKLTIQATGTTTAGMIRLFISDGTNHRLIREIPVIAITPSATQPAWFEDISFDGGLILQNTYSLRAATNNAETFNIIPTIAGDF
jgi:hypothetical protein